MHKKAGTSILARVNSAFKQWRAKRGGEYIPPVILAVSGLALLTAAAWTVALPLGLAAGGLSCFVLEWRIGEK